MLTFLPGKVPDVDQQSRIGDAIAEIADALAKEFFTAWKAQRKGIEESCLERIVSEPEPWDLLIETEIKIMARDDGERIRAN